MKQKAGLHKKISSIFDGVTVPKNNAQQQPDSDTQRQCAADQTCGHNSSVGNNTGPIAPPASLPSCGTPNIPSNTAYQSSSDIKPGQKHLSAKPTDGTSVKQKPSSTNKTSFTAKTRKASGSRDDDSVRQKKLTVLVAILAVIFAAVLFIALRPPAKCNAKIIVESAEQTTAAIQSPSQTAWNAPPEYPQELRDPMTIICAVNPDTPQDDSPETAAQNTELVIKGIVYSEKKPSAIISDRIVTQGETISGVTVIKISKDSVEFEKDGKSWTQQVQR